MAIQVKQRFKLDKDAIIYLIAQMIKGDKKVTEKFTEALGEIKPVVNEAKQKVEEALSKVTENDKKILEWCSENDQTKIDGGKIYMDEGFANSIFAKDITAEGTITGATIYGSHVEATSGTIGPFRITEFGLVSNATTTGLHIPYYASDPNGNTYQGHIDIGKYDNQSSWNSPIYIYRNGYGSSRLDADGLIVRGENVYGTECITGALTVVNGAYIQNDLTVRGGNICLDNCSYLKSYTNSGTIGRLMGRNENNTMLIGEYEKTLYIRFYADSTLVAQCIYNNTTSSGYNVRVLSDGKLYRLNSSSMRYKEQIKLVRDEDLNPENLYNLNVWQYKYRDGYLVEEDPRINATHVGFIAEEVQQYYPIAVQYTDDGYAENWEERYIIPPMLQLIKNQHEDIEVLKQQVNSLMEGANYERETN